MANEKRLIDADALMDTVEGVNWYHIDKLGYLASGANSQDHTPIYKAEDIYNAIRNAPTVDAVEVVRCKDCKHGTWDEEEAMWKCVYDAEFDEQYGEYFGFAEYNDGDHFCSYGERREGE